MIGAGGRVELAEGAVTLFAHIHASPRASSAIKPSLRSGMV